MKDFSDRYLKHLFASRLGENCNCVAIPQNESSCAPDLFFFKPLYKKYMKNKDTNLIAIFKQLPNL